MRMLAFVLVALLAAPPAGAQEGIAEVDRISGWIGAQEPGCVVGVARSGTVVLNRAYGLADVERGTPLGPNTAFDIGSTQKQFVAAAALLLVEDGRLSLDADVRKHLPELPDYGHTITVDHLLTVMRLERAPER